MPRPTHLVILRLDPGVSKEQIREATAEAGPDVLVRTIRMPVTDTVRDHLMRETGTVTCEVRELFEERPEPVDVVVTCHPAYLRFLPPVLAAWEAEQLDFPTSCLVLALDGVPEEAFPDPPGWTVVRGTWGHPGPARQASLVHCRSAWIHYWDADNEVPAGIGPAMRKAAGTAGREIGYLGPAIVEGREDQRDHWGADTNGLWRVSAIRQAGGWPEVSTVEDWALAVRIQALGYRLSPWENRARRRMHGANRSRDLSTGENMWRARPVAVVSLHRTEEMFLTWLATVQAHELPAPDLLHLVLLSDGGPSLKSLMARELADFPCASLVILGTDGRQLPAAPHHDTVARVARHDRVSGLYLRTMRHVPPECPVVLTWEDDVIPHRPDGLRLLSDQIRPNHSVGAAAGCYEERYAPGKCCMSLNADRWSGSLPMHRLGDHPQPVGMVPAGFTLWAASVVTGVFGPRQHGRRRLGWDASSSLAVTGACRSIVLHGGVRCDHLVRAADAVDMEVAA